MLDLTFGEQVKIVLSRKGMTIKELAEIIESKTGKKMSRQNLTQRLGRDNFQEQDMRMIAEILECPFQLNILNEDDSIESNYNNKEEAMVLKKRQKVADKKVAKETVAEPDAIKAVAQKEEPEVEAATATETAEPEVEVAAEIEVAEPEAEVALETEVAEQEAEVVTEPERAVTAPEVAGPEVHEDESAVSVLEEVVREREEVQSVEPEPEAVDYSQEYVAESTPEYTREYAEESTPEYAQEHEEAAFENTQEYAEEVAKPQETVEATPMEEHTESQSEEKKEEEKPKRGWFANFRRRGKDEKPAKEAKAEEVRPEPVNEPEPISYYEPENEMVQQGQPMDQFQDNGSYLNSLVQEASAQNNWYPQVEEAYREEVEAVETIPVDEEDLERGEINPYTGREYQTNSVRVHPKKIGYVQVYNRGIHAWEEMTEWAFLGYQEQKKAELGKAYEEPIYLD